MERNGARQLEIELLREQCYKDMGFLMDKRERTRSGSLKGIRERNCEFNIPNLRYMRRLNSNELNAERRKWRKRFSRQMDITPAHWVDRSFQTQLFPEKYQIYIHSFYSLSFTVSWEFSFAIQGKWITIRTILAEKYKVSLAADFPNRINQPAWSTGPYCQIQVGEMPIWTTDPVATRALSGGLKGVVRVHDGWESILKDASWRSHTMAARARHFLENDKEDEILWGDPWAQARHHINAIWITSCFGMATRVVSPILIKEIYLDHQAARGQRRRRLAFLRDVDIWR